MKKFLLKVYCWYGHFCDFDVPSHLGTLAGIGHTMLSIFIIFLIAPVLILAPSKEVFWNFYIEKVLFIAYLLLVWVFPILASIILAIIIPNDKLIGTKEYRLIEKQILNTWNKRSFIWFLLIRLMTFLLPYLLFVALIALFELVVNV